ncbi:MULTISPECIES: pilus assembly protein PilZ [Bradyrhizobium]|uniref:pilus assembly protein PilZ n=1 Tax=Bradyrhizobium TaxID=374 RepID=UPI00055B0CB7|nr:MULTISPECIES: pilus assembly protein PilZ [Bradyrhizobium]MCA1372194.1 PilZ domain-containing protein [Bradyrhizobium sp. IC4060]MCA1426379.1 PilZ domain-containing protein [Bradyrhizobium sp. NBAIM16]MCA1482678.1 PilZ domain-containing protein [Bradyrhizobium sp. IC4061]MCA1503741.1 PilZ domain-containing protein [Bradyrhizobium sp. NBAIM02]MCA1513288.1 PilZ domain-containing protein [Bradyrhizobium sp. NBAIM01]
MSVADFLRQRAVDVTVSGSYSLPRWYDCEGKLRSFACRTKRVSPFRMIVDVPVVGKVGERLTSYFEDFGEFQGTISATLKAGFLMELEMTRARRAWMSEKLTWLEKKQKDVNVRDLRRDARFVPQVSHTVLTLADGSCHPCFIIDVSTAGVAVSSEYDPVVGTPLAVGACVGRVIRKFEHGFAVKFAEKLDRDDLVRLIVRAPLLKSA